MCLDSVLMLVDVEGGCHAHHPKLAELCYFLLYIVCVGRKSSSSTLRYLRSNGDFVCRQLMSTPMPRSGMTDESMHMFMNQQAFILKLVALELRMSFLHNQHSHTLQLLSSFLQSSSSRVNLNGGLNVFSAPCHRKVVELLHALDFDVPCPDLELEHFKQPQTEDVIKRCEVGSNVRERFVNIEQLDRILMNEMNFLSGSASYTMKNSIINVSCMYYSLTCCQGYNKVVATWSQLCYNLVITLHYVVPMDKGLHFVLPK